VGGSLGRARAPRFQSHLGILTSGTGGSGSLVLLSLAALRCSAAAVNRHLGATSRDSWLNVLPTFHVGGFGVYARAAALGARVVELPAGWDPTGCMEVLRRERVSFLSLVPTQLHDLVAAGHRAPGTLRALVIGGARLEEELRTRARYLGWPVLPSYGLTECASQVATAAMSSLRDDGAPPALHLLDHIDARIETSGRIAIRSGALCTAVVRDVGGAGCLNYLAPDGWFTSEDLGELRDGRALDVRGRGSDFVKIKGEGVSLPALRARLREIVGSSGISAPVLLAPVAHERDGAELVLLTTAHPAELEPLQAAMNSGCAPFERIRGVVQVPRIIYTDLQKPRIGATLALAGLSPVSASEEWTR